MAHCWIYPKVLCPSKQFVDISCDCNWWSSKFTCSRKAPWACRFAFGICSICPWFQRPRHGKLYQVVHSLHTSKIWLLFFQSRVSEYLYVFVYIYIYTYIYIYIFDCICISWFGGPLCPCTGASSQPSLSTECCGWQIDRVGHVNSNQTTLVDHSLYYSVIFHSPR